MLYCDFMTESSNRERLETKYRGARRLQEASASLPGGAAARFELAEGELVPLSARTRWSILGRFLEVEFSFRGDERRFRFRTRSDAPFRPGSSIEAVCGYWPRPLGRNRPFYEVSEVVERDSDRRHTVSVAAQFGPVVLIAAVVIAAVVVGLVKRAAG